MSDKCVEEVKARMRAWVHVGMPSHDGTFSSVVARAQHVTERGWMPEYRAMARKLGLLLRRQK